MNLQMTPQLEQRFRQIDTDNSGQIDPNELCTAFGSISFTQHAAKLLLQGISDKPYADRQNFPLLDFYINAFYQAFQQQDINRTGRITEQQVIQACTQLNFTAPLATLSYITKKFDKTKQGTDYGSFMSICSYMLICGRLMTRFDAQKKGSIIIDYNGLLNLGLWFL